MPDPSDQTDLDAQAEQMLNAALGGLTPHEALIQASLADKENAAERADAINKNRERALKMLEALEKSLGK